MSVADAPLLPAQVVRAPRTSLTVSAARERGGAAGQPDVAELLLRRSAEPATLEVRSVVG